ncbi:hypothetical protein [Albirhodobacter sp. R86504]|uniref:hypothetical protein n=1 Tax=Albirhodobacter sp. R86504 TaxID=3093848 RepID=UPI00366E303D
MSLRNSLLALGLTSLAACGSHHGITSIPDQTGTVVYGGQEIHANHGPVTTHPIIGQGKVPAGMTPTGGTGYAVANTARSNGSIVNGQAAPCGAANSAAYSDGCAHYAGGPIAATPYQ